MSLYLHVGWPKTGTSFLQMFFAMNQKVLFENGVVYPEFFDLTFVRKGVYGQGNGFSLAYHFLDDKSITKCSFPEVNDYDLLSCLRKYRNETKVLISTEWFTCLSDQALLKIKRVAESAGHDVKLVAYIRPFLEFVESEYAQGIKQGVSSLDVVSENIKPSYKEVLCRMMGVFGEEALCVRPYLPEQWVDGELWKDFIATLDVLSLADGYTVPGRVNSSVHPLLLAVQLRCNRLGMGFSEKEILTIQSGLSDVLRNYPVGTWLSDSDVDFYKKLFEPEKCWLQSHVMSSESGFLLRDHRKEGMFRNMDYLENPDYYISLVREVEERKGEPYFNLCAHARALNQFFISTFS